MLATLLGLICILPTVMTSIFYISILEHVVEHVVGIDEGNKMVSKEINCTEH